MNKFQRRSILLGGASAVLLTGCWEKENTSVEGRPKYVLVFDQNKCIGCGVCKDACVQANNVPAGFMRMTLERQSPPGARGGERRYVRVSCQQCESAPCVRVCPTGAAHRDPQTGIVTMDNDRCVGCKYCIAACPYNVRFINPVTKAAENCDFCLHSKLAQGELPACVQACRHGALEFGNLADQEAFVAKLLKVKDSVRIRPELGTEPSLRYIPKIKTGVEA